MHYCVFLCQSFTIPGTGPFIPGMVISKVKNTASHMMFGEHTVVPHINTMWNESKRDVFGMYNSTNQPRPIINVNVMLAKCCHKFAKCGMLPKWLQ